MLSFAAPLRIVSGHPVFADHAVADLFHVLPDQPRLEIATTGLPAFSLTRFVGDAPDGSAIAGGFVSLATVLTIPPAKLVEIGQRLSAELGRPARVSPVLFDEGAVELVLLGQAGAANNGSPFEVTTLGSARPSMAGENTAAFQVQLNAAASGFIEGCIGDPTIPALVIYRMALSGLQPAFNIKITADWSRLQVALDSRFRANVYYVRVDLEAKLREAVTEAELKVETTVTDADAADEAQVAERALLDFITDTFFDPSYGAAPPEPGRGVVDAIKGSIMDVIDTLMPGASFKMKMMRDNDVRHIDARLDRSMVRRRDLVFQASIGGELHGLRVDAAGLVRADWPATRAKLVTGVNIAGIGRREVALRVVDRFASDGLSAVEVDLALQGVDGTMLHRQTVIFHDAADTDLYAVNLLGADPSLLTEPYLYRLRVHFDPGAVFGPQPAGEGPWVQGRATTLTVDPRVDGPYQLRQPLVATAPGFPFAQFPSVIVDLRKTAEDGHVAQSETLVLTAAKPDGKWTFRGHGDDAAEFEYRVIFDRDLAVGGPIEREWTAVSAPRLTLPDPAPHRRRITIFPDLPWSELSLAFVELRYNDPAHDIAINERIALTRETGFVERDYAIADPLMQAIEYRLTTLVVGRGLVQGDWRETSDTTIVLGRDLFEMRAIRFRALGLPVSAHGLSQLILQAEALGPDGTRLHDHRVPLGAQDAVGDLGTWTFPKLAPQVARVRVRADWRDANGFPGDTGWLDWSRDLVLFRLPQKAFQP